MFIRHLKNNASYRFYPLFFSGLLLGMACGFKMTIIPQTVALGITCLCFFKSLDKPLKTYFVLGLGVFLGYLITNGFWMLALWLEFQNPFFPFFNNIFKSAYALPVYISDASKMPVSWREWLLFPVNMMQFNDTATDIENNSFNIPLGLVASVGLLVLRKTPRILKFLSVFFLVAYVMWLSFTAILRYMIPVELLSGILLVGFCASFIKKKILVLCSVLLLVFVNVYACCHYTEWYDVRKIIGYQAPDFYIKTKPLSLQRGVVLLLMRRQLSFFIPQMKGDFIVASMSQNWSKEKPETNISLTGKLRPLLPMTSEKRFAVISNKVLEENNCERLHNTIYPHSPYYMCPSPNENGVVEGYTLDELLFLSLKTK